MRHIVSDRIVSDPGVCGGEPCIQGTRILVEVVLDNLAAGMTWDDLVDDLPGLTRDDIAAALRFASRSIRSWEEIELEAQAG